MILLRGTGSDLTNKKAIERRARCKIITQKTILCLIDIAKEKGADERVKAYWNTYYCQDKITTADSMLYTNYCKNRFCTHCCGIRKAELINRYLPILNEWEDPYFLTLTVKAVKAHLIRSRIEEINSRFNTIKAKYRKRNERGTDIKLMGLKTIECNFNPIFQTYNPHIHLIVPSFKITKILLAEWLQTWGKKLATPGAQYYRKVKDREKDLVEIIKYEAKIITEPALDRNTGKQSQATIYARALDNIYAAMKGCRLIDRFGFDCPKRPKKKVEEHLVQDCHFWEYHSKSMNWLSSEHESTLTNFVPSAQLIEILEHNINTTLE
jgi:hypothetical protein